ncbi:hypothetical protein Droror1_Dr00006764 [Drosera rotundifolia]
MDAGKQDKQNKEKGQGSSKPGGKEAPEGEKTPPPSSNGKTQEFDQQYKDQTPYDTAKESIFMVVAAAARRSRKSQLL